MEQDYLLILQSMRCVHVCFFKNANKEQCGELIESVENQCALGTDNFPKTIAKAHEALGNYR